MACVASLLTPSDLSSLSLLTSAWRYEGWLHAYPLNRATVLDYFKHSPFYSLQANNERINAATAAAASQQQQQQGQHTSPPAAVTASSSSLSSLSALRHMEGLEFVLDAPPAVDSGGTATAAANSTAGSYFVIRKQWRVSPSVVRLLAAYYVVAVLEPAAATPLSASSLPTGSVIPMPHFHSLANCALDSSAATLSAAIRAIARIHHRRTQRQCGHTTEQQRTERADSDEWMEEAVEQLPSSSGKSEIGGVAEDDELTSARTTRPLYAHMAAEAIRLTSAV